MNILFSPYTHQILSAIQPNLERGTLSFPVLSEGGGVSRIEELTGETAPLFLDLARQIIHETGPIHNVERKIWDDLRGNSKSFGDIVFDNPGLDAVPITVPNKTPEWFLSSSINEEGTTRRIPHLETELRGPSGANLVFRFGNETLDLPAFLQSGLSFDDYDKDAEKTGYARMHISVNSEHDVHTDRYSFCLSSHSLRDALNMPRSSLAELASRLSLIIFMESGQYTLAELGTVIPETKDLGPVSWNPKKRELSHQISSFPSMIDIIGGANVPTARIGYEEDSGNPEADFHILLHRPITRKERTMVLAPRLKEILWDSVAKLVAGKG